MNKLLDIVLNVVCGAYLAWLMWLAVLLADGLGFSHLFRCLFIGVC